MTLFVLLQVLILLAEFVNAKDRELQFSVQHTFAYPDGYRRRAIITNGQLTAPEIRVKKGDFLRATFYNDFDTDVFTMHWHGLFQKGTPWEDGVYMGTQCSILEEFTYKFPIQNEPGSYIYHAHQGALRIDGLTGPFIIEDPPELKNQLGYEDEFTIFFLDWYHVTSEFLTLMLAQPQPGSEPVPPYYNWVGDPDSYLINGKGYWNSTSEDVSETNFNQSMASFETYTVKKGNKYMFRIMSATSLSYSNVWIQDHKMTIVRVDGELVEPLEVDSLDINSHERYDVIVEMNQPSDTYWIQIETRFRKLIKGWALLKYEDAPISQIPSIENPIGLENLPGNPLPLNDTEWDPNMLEGLEELEGAISELYPNRTLFVGSDLKWVQNTNNQLQARWSQSLNGPQNNSIPYDYSVSPLLYMLYKDRCDLIGEDVVMWPNVCKGEESLKMGEIVDVVFQSYPAFDSKVDQHPWHLHGFNFYVLGHGAGEFSYEYNGDELNLLNPMKRDTVTVYPSRDGKMLINEAPLGVPLLTPSGWTVIRFRVDNPGVWNMHCHITWHLYMGMELFIISDIENIPPPPKSLPECGPVRLFEQI